MGTKHLFFAGYGGPKPNSLNRREICRLQKIQEFFFEMVTNRRA